MTEKIIPGVLRVAYEKPFKSHKEVPKIKKGMAAIYRLEKDLDKLFIMNDKQEYDDFVKKDIKTTLKPIKRSRKAK